MHDRFGNLLFSIGLLAFYLFLGVLFSSFVPNSLLVMLIVDVIIFLICVYFYWQQYHVTFTPKIVISKMEWLSIYGLVLICWFVVQVTASAFYVLYGDASFDAYSNAVQSQSDLVIRSVLSILVAPLMEELLFRGVLFNAIKRYSLPLSYFLSALVFAAFHGTILHLYVGFVLGLVFALIYQYTGHLRFAVLAHMFSNLLTLFFMPVIAPFVMINNVFVVVANFVLIVGLVVCYVFVENTAEKRNMTQLDIISDVTRQI